MSFIKFRFSRIIPQTRNSVVNIRFFSAEDSSDDEKKRKNIDETRKNNEESKKKSEAALKRLNELLGSMSSTRSENNVEIIMAKNKREESKTKEKPAEDPKSLK